MTTDEEFMFKWIEKREVFWRRELRELQHEVERFGIAPESFAGYSPDVRDAAIKQAFREVNPGIHWSGDGAAKTSIGTQLAICVRAMDILARGDGGPDGANP